MASMKALHDLPIGQRKMSLDLRENHDPQNSYRYFSKALLSQQEVGEIMPVRDNLKKLISPGTPPTPFLTTPVALLKVLGTPPMRSRPVPRRSAETQILALVADREQKRDIIAPFPRAATERAAAAAPLIAFYRRDCDVTY